MLSNHQFQVYNLSFYNLLNYGIFLKYCEGRKFVPCSKELYEEAISKNDKIKHQKQEQKKPAVTPEPRKKREVTKKEPTRKISTSPKPKRRRTSTKKQSKS